MIAAVVLALVVGVALREGYGVAASEPEVVGIARLELVEREGKPWLLWVGDQPSAVEFQMESRARYEVVGRAEETQGSHAMELAGWLGRGPVKIHAHPTRGTRPPPLEIAPADVTPYLDRLAASVVERRDEAAWRHLGRFAELYFETGVGSLETKRRLQRILVGDLAAAGPGGARWLWGETWGPSSHSRLPGAPLAEAPELRPRSAGPGEPGMTTRLPIVETDEVELQVQVEVSPTPARDYHLVATLEGGWPVLLTPGPEGGEAYQRLDARALGPAGTQVVVTVHGPEDLRVSVVRLGLRYLPRAPGGVVGAKS
jgi:hypothetical protein